VDLHSHLGSAFEVEEPTESITPGMKAVDAFTSAHPDVRDALGSGVTTVALAPGNGNLIGGRVGAIKLNGGRYDRALFRDSLALKASLTDDALRRDREPTSRTGAARLLREFLAAGKPSGPLLVYASTTAEIQAALEAAGGASMVLVGARDAGRMADALRGAVAGVAFGPLTVSDRKDVLEAPGKLARAGLPIAFVSDAPATAEMHLRASAAFAVKHGLDRGVALRALTAAPAEFLGLAKEIGSLEEGRDADVVVWTGDPLNLSSGVDTVLVNGKVTWRRPKP
jgi:imidazolonepropionase-like amidohydrolase